MTDTIPPHIYRKLDKQRNEIARLTQLVKRLEAEKANLVRELYLVKSTRNP